MSSPSASQKEAYARYCHTISAAGLIGAATLVFSDSALTISAFIRAATMLIAAVLLFVLGTLLNAED